MHLASWLILLFFLPVINVIFFGFLALSPELPATAEEGTSAIFHSDSTTSLFASVATAAGCGCLVIGISVAFLGSYGIGLFLATPFCMGLLTTLLLSIGAPRSVSVCFAWSLLALALTGLALITVAIEGLVCLVMAIPLAIPLT